jgi:tetratricopeptide (TPR) repeat protein
MIFIFKRFSLDEFFAPLRAHVFCFQRNTVIMKKRLFLNIIICCFLIPMLCSCMASYIVSNPSSYNEAKVTAARTHRAIATVGDSYHGKYYSYTRLSIYSGGSPRTFQVDYCIDGSAYQKGDKLAIQYDPKNLSNVRLLMDQPYFAPGDLPDTTEGIVQALYDKSSCKILYKVYDSSDSFDVEMRGKTRFLNQEMFDTSSIKLNCVYKILYNKKNIRSTNAEILFKEVKDDSHTELNKHLYGAMYMLTEGNPIVAIADLNHCIQLDPYNPYYFFQRAKAHGNVHENEKALEDFNKYIQLVPDDKRGYQRRAGVYIQTKKYEEAQKDVNTLFSLNDESGEADYLQGVIYYHKKEYKKAIESYTKALALCKGKQKEVYYYDRAVAREKLIGKNNQQSKRDYLMARKTADQYDEPVLHGHHTHTGDLHYNDHSVYWTITSDNSFSTLGSYSSLNSHMQGTLIYPVAIDGTPKVYEDKFSLNTTRTSSAFSLGVLSIEGGGFKRFYGRMESGFSLNNGKGSPWNLRGAFGYNIKMTKKDFIIIRPELGCTYQNRQIVLDAIKFNGASTVNVMGHNFHHDGTADEVDISFRENVFNFSPALGIWLFPYKTKFVLRLSGGYNWCFSQNYSIYAKSYKDHLRERLENTNITISNTNGQNSNFFRYQGLFVSVSVGGRF